MDFTQAWKMVKEWFNRNFTWKGAVAALVVLYQLIPDTAGRNQYWISMYPTIRDFVLHHLRPVLIILFGLFIWLDHRHTLSKQRKPKGALELTIEGNIWVLDSENDRTVFVLSAYLLNTGEPTVAKSWSAEYEFNGVKEPMTGLYLIDSYTVTVGEQSLTIENKHLLNAQTLSSRLETGDAKAGRLIFFIKGDRLSQVQSLQFRIHVQCSDYAGRIASAVFIPDPKPLEGMKMYPGEVMTKKPKKTDTSTGPQLVAETPKTT